MSERNARSSHGPLHVLLANPQFVSEDRLRDTLRPSQWVIANAAGDAVPFNRDECDVIVVESNGNRDQTLRDLDHVRTAFPKTATVVLAHRVDIPHTVDCMRRGAYDLLRWPLSKEDLTRSMAAAAEHTRQARCGHDRSNGNSSKPGGGPELVGVSPAMGEVRDTISRIAPTDISVLIVGDSGTGKEVAARRIVAESLRADQAFHALNCAALPASLMGSELFGHERGAFTGADRTRPGLFECADGGTLFLDEFTEIPVMLQAKLLRAVQFREVRRVGGQELIKTDVRLIAATNRNPEEEIRKGTLRADLYHRLAAITLAISPLCERPDDIPPLINHILREKLPRGITPPMLNRDAVIALQRHSWPGNVRELENLLIHLALMSETGVITAADVQAILSAPKRNGTTTSQPLTATLEEVERSHILALLAASGGNKTETARRLGITKRTLYNKLNRYSGN